MTIDNQSDLMETLRVGDRVIMDGAMGTELERRGVPFEGKGWSAIAVRDCGAIIRDVHEDYIKAGARLHIVNSFALARHVLEPVGLAHQFEYLNRRAVTLFDDAVNRLGVDRGDYWVAGSLSTFAANSDRSLLPTGQALIENYRDQAGILLETGIDIFAFEMLFDIEVSLAMLKAVEESGLPVILGFTCEWERPDAPSSVTARSMGCPALPLEELLPTVIDSVDTKNAILAVMHSEVDVTDAALEILTKFWDGPTAIYPNSGEFIDLRMQFETVCSVDSFEIAARRWLDSGVQIVGGCCGLGPEHIQALSEIFQQQKRN